MKHHQYKINLQWTGNTGSGTSSYMQYERAHEVTAPYKPILPMSSDPAFRGDPARYNPEELLVSAIASCHMLWYLHLCVSENIVVTAYKDNAEGKMMENKDGSGRFQQVILKPEVIITDESKTDLAKRLHSKAHAMCFIASSVNFEVLCEPVCTVGKMD